jgi:hypothetical protein
MRREGELKLFGNTSIPNQGILFDGTAPVDEWKYPMDGRRVWERLASERGPQSSCRSPSPPPVPLKDGNMEGKVHKSRDTHSTFALPTNTNFVTYQRPKSYGNPRMMLTPIGQSNHGETQDEGPNRTHNQVNRTPKSSYNMRSN